VEEGEEYRGGFNVTAPITDNLAFRVAGYVSDTDGWVKDVSNGNYYNGGETRTDRQLGHLRVHLDLHYRLS